MQATTQEQHDTLYVEAYNLVDFLMTTQKHIQDGWVFDFEKNEHSPLQLGFRYVATLVKPQALVGAVDAPPEPSESTEEVSSNKAPEDTQQEVVAVVEPTKRGRKKV